MLKELSFQETTNLLHKYKLPTAKAELISSIQELNRFIKKQGYPIVLKTNPNKYLHKSDVKGVYLNIDTEKQALKIFKRLKKLDDLILAQKMYSGSYVILGAKRNPVFNIVLMFGLGGIFTEILKDVSFRISPVTEKEVISMIKEIKGHKILLGARGYPRINLKALASTILKMQRLMKENPKIKEFEINPLIVNEKKFICADVRVLYE